jgi:hypothetical protein
MNTHPDIAARAASIIHRERITAAQQAKLINQAQTIATNPAEPSNACSTASSG